MAHGEHAVVLLRRHGSLRGDRPDHDRRQCLGRSHALLSVLRHIFLVVLIVVFGDFVSTNPMAALVEGMTMVPISAFDPQADPEERALRDSTARTSRFGDSLTYVVNGELFFASSNDLTTLFSYSADPDSIVVDLTGSHIWDASTVAALDAIETKYTALGKSIEIIGMNESSQRMRGKLTGGFE